MIVHTFMYYIVTDIKLNNGRRGGLELESLQGHLYLFFLFNGKVGVTQMLPYIFGVNISLSLEPHICFMGEHLLCKV